MPENRNLELGIAHISCQTWTGNLYEPITALKKGTIFPELNMPFYVVDTPDHLAAKDNLTESTMKCPEQKGREELMGRIHEVSFFVNDLTLYLDTHPNDSEALKIFQEKLQERAMLIKTFAEQYYPLTQSVMELPAGGQDSCQYTWSKGPLPWEGACV